MFFPQEESSFNHERRLNNLHKIYQINGGVVGEFPQKHPIFYIIRGNQLN